MIRRGGLGFGGAVGLGVAIALLIIVIAIGRALARQLTAAMSLVITFAEIAVCTILAGVAIAALGLLVYGGQLGRVKLAERRITLERFARESRTVRAEVLEDDREPIGLDGRQVPGAIGPPRADVSAHSRISAQPHVVTSRAPRPRCAGRDGRRS